MAHRSFAGSLPAPFSFFLLNVLVSSRSIVGNERVGSCLTRITKPTPIQPSAADILALHQNSGKSVSPRYECMVRAAPIGSPVTRVVVYCAQYFPDAGANLKAYLKSRAWRKRQLVCFRIRIRWRCWSRSRGQTVFLPRTSIVLGEPTGDTTGALRNHEHFRTCQRTCWRILSAWIGGAALDSCFVFGAAVCRWPSEFICRSGRASSPAAKRAPGCGPASSGSGRAGADIYTTDRRAGAAVGSADRAVSGFTRGADSGSVPLSRTGCRSRSLGAGPS